MYNFFSLIVFFWLNVKWLNFIEWFRLHCNYKSTDKRVRLISIIIVFRWINQYRPIQCWRKNQRYGWGSQSVPTSAKITLTNEHEQKEWWSTTIECIKKTIGSKKKNEKARRRVQGRGKKFFIFLFVWFCVIRSRSVASWYYILYVRCLL